MSSRDDPTYRILIRGQVSSRFMQVFDRLDLETDDGTSTLVGPVRDHAELQGMLDLLSGLNLTILRVETAPSPALPRRSVETRAEGYA